MSSHLKTPASAPDANFAVAVFAVGLPLLSVLVMAVVLNWGR